MQVRLQIQEGYKKELFLLEINGEETLKLATILKEH